MENELTLDAALARLDGVRKAGNGYVAKCPSHPDNNPSLSITEKGGKVLMKCFSGCAFDDIREALGFDRPNPMKTNQFTGLSLHHGTEAQKAQLGELRGVGTVAVNLAVNNGLVRFGTWHKQAVWAVTDPTENNTQLRRLDGKPIKVGDNERKSHTVKGSTASWPIGIKQAQDVPCIMLVEGGPDLLAAYARIEFENRQHDTKPVAMLGASNSIPDVALPYFKGKRVYVYPHVDEAGVKAAERWMQQLLMAGCYPRTFSLMGMSQRDGQPVGDLNDTVHCSGAELLRKAKTFLPTAK